MVSTPVIRVTWIATHLPTPEGWKAELARWEDGVAREGKLGMEKEGWEEGKWGLLSHLIWGSDVPVIVKMSWEDVGRGTGLARGSNVRNRPISGSCIGSY